MSKAVKERKAEQRKKLTFNRVVDGVTKFKQAEAKNNQQEKLRQQFVLKQRFANYGGIYND